MTEIQKQLVSIPEVKPRTQDKSSIHREGMKGETEAKDCFVALDIGTLSLLVASETKDSTPSPQLSLQKTLSRKGSQRVGEGGRERKLAAAEEETVHLSPGSIEKPPLVGHVAGEIEACTVAHVTTPTARCRRVVGRRPPLWLDPRRVVVFFAALSCMGTLILLYFTLSMGRMASGDANAR